MNTIGIPAHLMASPEDTAQAGPKNKLGKEDFLKLLMAQMKQQDPLNPLKHEEFASQLAQFSSLEHLSNIGKGIEGLQTGMSSETKLQALGMIGKEIKASGNEVELLSGESVALNYKHVDRVTPVKASVYGSDGKVVREISITRGDTKGQIQWDGLNQAGQPVAAGKYTFRIQGVSTQGQAEELSAEMSGKVVGVDMNGRDPLLVVQTPAGKTHVKIDRISSISMGAEPQQAPNPAAQAVSVARDSLKPPTPTSPSQGRGAAGEPLSAWRQDETDP